MKKLLILLLALPLLGSAQDQIYTTDNDTIDCRIKRIDDKVMYYSIKIGGKLKSKSIGMSKVKGHIWESKSAPMSKYNRSPGNELRLASKRGGLGVVMTFGGIAVIALSQGSKDVHTTLQVMGGAISIIGVMFMLNGWSHISKAGILMDEHKLGITFNDGIGIRYRI